MCPREGAATRPRPFWERGYKDLGVSTMGGPNHDMVELAAGLPPGARVLDLGCGEGRNAFFLAGRGCEVTAVDISDAAIEKLGTLAERTGLRIDLAVADISEYPITGAFDLVMAHGVIDYLENAQWRELLERVRDHTLPGGFNAYTCMLFTDEHPTLPELAEAGFKHSLAPGELAGFYSDWSLIRHDRYVKWDQHPGVPEHCHPVDKVVARRPGGGGAPALIADVPTGDGEVPRDVFDGISMGLPAEQLARRCGEPDVVDRFTMEGAQVGVGPESTVDGYSLSLWYYGRSVFHVVNDRVWGRSLYDSTPVRVSFQG